MNQIQTIAGIREATPVDTQMETPRLNYCLYARKSTESEERQTLSIDSQIKEMLELAAKENMKIADIRRESHSAKSTGERPVFNELLGDIRTGKYLSCIKANAISIIPSPVKPNQIGTQVCR